MEQRLAGKTALITGASRGIGAAIAERFAAEGAQLLIVSRKIEGIEASAAAINEKYPHSTRAKVCHVGDPEAIEELFQESLYEIGAFDILVNNAGTNPYFGPMIGASHRAFDKTIDVNIRGPFEASRQFAKAAMLKQKPGSIINIASILGQAASPLQGIYGMTKAALISMTQTMAAEWGPANIRVNAIAPGLIETRLSQTILGNKDFVQSFNERTPLGRPGQTDEVSGAALFLASDESTYVTGHTLNVDGGYATR
jgi:NAD(P)-dependent dehydrogenase (short-subunit alcohol dehydrogenase family)